MTKHLSKAITNVISGIALLVSIATLYLSWSWHSIDFDAAVIVQPGVLPIVQLHDGKNPVDLEIINTSKSNLRYFLRVDTNMGCINGSNGRPLFFPCKYESQIVSLSKVGAKNTNKHILMLDARPGEIATNPLAYISDPSYFLRIEIVDASNGRRLFLSQCFYNFQTDTKVFSLDQPVMDTSGESDRRQRECRS